MNAWTPEAIEKSRELAVELGQLPPEERKEIVMTNERSVANVFLDNPEGVRVHFAIVEGTEPDALRKLLINVDTLIEAKIQQGYRAAVMQDRGQRRPAETPTKQPNKNIREVKRQRVSADVPECDYCGGPCWDNTEDKRSPKAPDYKCKDEECGAAAWIQKDGELRWVAGE